MLKGEVPPNCTTTEGVFVVILKTGGNIVLLSLPFYLFFGQYLNNKYSNQYLQPQEYKGFRSFVRGRIHLGEASGCRVQTTQYVALQTFFFIFL